jgi:hypothetical protein
MNVQRVQTPNLYPNKCSECESIWWQIPEKKCSTIVARKGNPDNRKKGGATRAVHQIPIASDICFE